MEITEVRVALHESREKRLKAYATLTFDSYFVVRNIKIIEGKNGLFVAMPSRKPKVTCSKCAFKVELGGALLHAVRQCAASSGGATGGIRVDGGPSAPGHRASDHGGVSTVPPAHGARRV